MIRPVLRSLAALSAFAGTALLTACVAGAADADADGDSWGVRLSGQRLESLSDVNTGKPLRAGELRTRRVATRQGGKSMIDLHADAATAARLDAQAGTYAPELDKALDWLQRIRPSAQPRATIIVTLIDTRHRTTQKRVYAALDATIVDIVVPIPDAPMPVSIGVGKALATALHEMQHAVSARGGGRLRPSRRDDEYQASLVESCYLVDTIRTGDTLRLVPREQAAQDEYFVTAQSRNAARDAIRELVRASGTPTVRWYDHTALLGLKLACGTSLPARSARGDSTPVPAPLRRGSD